jgi:hypothetical protein
MAGRSQLPVQIMENQTRFDLNAAVENWRNELAAQPNLAPDDRRELETHLRDAIAGFQLRGLNDEESFWLARRRVGQPQQLVDEFVKANPNTIWRERVFWMANALLFINLWSSLIGAFSLKYARGNSNYLSPPLKDKLPDWIFSNLPHWLQGFLNMSVMTFLFCISCLSDLLIILCCVLFLTSGRLRNRKNVLGFIFQSRTRFILVGLLLVLAVNFMMASATVSGTLVTQVFFMRLIFYSPWTLSLIGLIAWLMSPQNRKTPKRA